MSFTPPMDPPLRAVFLRDENDTVIVRATAREVAAFTAATPAGTELDLRRTRVRMTLGGGGWTGFHMALTSDPPDPTDRPRGEISMRSFRDGVAHLYDEHGRPVAYITEINQSASMIDVTTFSSRRPAFLAGGARTIEIRAMALPGVRVV